jgi:lysophospholipase L1-like esterase
LRNQSILYQQLRLGLWDLKRFIPQNPFPQYLDSTNTDWILTQELIKAIRDESTKHKAKFLLVILPQRDYLNGSFNPIVYEKIEEFAIREKIQYINILPEMTAFRWTDLFYPEDGHFTPLGARLTAQAIFQVIQPWVAHEEYPF